VVDQSGRQPYASESCIDAFRYIFRRVPYGYDPALTRRGEEPIEAKGVHLAHGIPHDPDLLDSRQKRSGGTVRGLDQRLTCSGRCFSQGKEDHRARQLSAPNVEGREE